MCRKLKLKKLDALLIIYKAQILNRKKYNKRQEKQAYFCDSCNAWHTSSMTLKEYLELI